MVYHDPELFTDSISQSKQVIPRVLKEKSKEGAEARWRMVVSGCGRGVCSLGPWGPGALAP